MSSPLDFILWVQILVSAVLSTQERGGICVLGSISPFCFGGYGNQRIRVEGDGEKASPKGPLWATIWPSLENYFIFKSCF